MQYCDTKQYVNVKALDNLFCDLNILSHSLFEIFTKKFQYGKKISFFLHVLLKLNSALLKLNSAAGSKSCAQWLKRFICKINKKTEMSKSILF